jgi:hypothetical protein
MGRIVEKSEEKFGVREGTSVDGFPTRNPLKFDAGGLVGGI